MVEFVSANPTGPLHVGHAPPGRARRRDLQPARDAGLATSCASSITTTPACRSRRWRTRSQARARRPQAGRRRLARGRLQRRLHRRHRRRLPRQEDGARPTTASSPPRGDVDDLDGIRQFAVAYLRHEQDLDLQAFGVRFDNYYLESSLYTSGRVEATVRAPRRRRQDLRGGRRAVAAHDRLRRRQGPRDAQVRRHATPTSCPTSPTTSTKFERGFTKAINIQGTDHHGTIARVRAGLQAAGVGVPPGYPDYVLHKMVTVMRGGEEVKISKRAGSYVTLRDLIDWTSRDAVRFFLLQPQGRHRVHLRRRPRAQAERREPGLLRAVRACAHLLGARAVRGAGRRRRRAWPTPTCRCWPRRARPRCCASSPTTRRCSPPRPPSLAPHEVAFYLRELAAAFHSYYAAERFLVDDADAGARAPRPAGGDPPDPPQRARRCSASARPSA